MDLLIVVMCVAALSVLGILASVGILIIAKVFSFSTKFAKSMMKGFTVALVFSGIGFFASSGMV